MATSGTVGQTTISAIDIIDHSILRCGIEPAKITGEMIQTARKNLFYYIVYLANKGVNLWTIEKNVMGLYPYQRAYDTPVGTIDILNLLYRTQNIWQGNASSSAGGNVGNAFDQNVATYCQQASPNGNIAMGVNNTVMTTVGFMPYGSQTYHLIWEYSDDQVTWTTLYDPGVQIMVDGQWYWSDLDKPKQAQFIRVRETGGATLAAREIALSWNPNEIPISRNNRDDYANLPDKGILSFYPTQFWFDRKITQPQIVLWPVPQSTFVSLVVWRHRQIQDIGDLTNDIEFPQRWYEAVLANVATRNALDIPGVDSQRIQLLGQLASTMEEPAYDEERDKSNSYFTPNIGSYTGGRGICR